MRKNIIPFVVGLYLVACTQKEKQISLGSDALQTESGLEYVYLSKGSGPNPVLGEEVKAHCILKVGDSSEIWNTRTEDNPYSFIYAETGFIKGWIEIMGVVKVGDRIKVIIPPDMGYGPGGAGDDIPGNAFLSFDIEVLESTDIMLWIADSLFATYAKYGKDATRAHYNRMKSDDSAKYFLNERQLKILAGSLRNDGRLNGHFEMTRLWAEEYPKSLEAHFMLASVHKELNRCLEIDPDNEVVLNRLAELE